MKLATLLLVFLFLFLAHVSARNNIDLTTLEQLAKAPSCNVTIGCPPQPSLNNNRLASMERLASTPSCTSDIGCPPPPHKNNGLTKIEKLATAPSCNVKIGCPPEKAILRDRKSAYVRLSSMIAGPHVSESQRRDNRWNLFQSIVTQIILNQFFSRHSLFDSVLQIIDVSFTKVDLNSFLF